MDKIKVSKEVATALDNALKTKSKELFFRDHCDKFRWTLDIYLPLNQISNWEMAQILINDYEVEETPEEVIAHAYKFHNQNDEYDRGWKHAVEHTLNTLEVKIKGIND